MAQAAPDMADHGVGKLENAVGDAATVQKFAGKNVKRNGEQRHAPYPAGKLLGSDGERRVR